MIKLNGKLVEFEEFPNKETRIKEESMEVNNKHEAIYFKFGNDSDLIKLLLLKSYLDDLSVAPKVLTLSYMPYSRQDRVESKSPFTLKYISNLINSMNFDKVYVVEPHSDVTPALLNKSESVHVYEHLMNYAMHKSNFDIETDYIVFPDATAAKRYGNTPVKNKLTGIKHRNFETGKIESFELAGKVDKKGFKAILIDDLCSYGGTFLATANALKNLGADEIYLVTTHCEDSIFDGELFKSDLIDHIYTTDSIMTKQNYWFNANKLRKMTVFSVEDLLVLQYEN